VVVNKFDIQSSLAYGKDRILMNVSQVTCVRNTTTLRTSFSTSLVAILRLNNTMKVLSAYTSAPKCGIIFFVDFSVYYSCIGTWSGDSVVFVLILELELILEYCGWEGIGRYGLFRLRMNVRVCR